MDVAVGPAVATVAGGAGAGAVGSRGQGEGSGAGARRARTRASIAGRISDPGGATMAMTSKNARLATGSTVPIRWTRSR